MFVESNEAEISNAEEGERCDAGLMNRGATCQAALIRSLVANTTAEPAANTSCRTEKNKIDGLLWKTLQNQHVSGRMTPDPCQYDVSECSSRERFRGPQRNVTALCGLRYAHMYTYGCDSHHSQEIRDKNITDKRNCVLRTSCGNDTLVRAVVSVTYNCASEVLAHGRIEPTVIIIRQAE
jgi:hypothetical protein